MKCFKLLASDSIDIYLIRSIYIAQTPQCDYEPSSCDPLVILILTVLARLTVSIVATIQGKRFESNAVPSQYDLTFDLTLTLREIRHQGCFQANRTWR